MFNLVCMEECYISQAELKCNIRYALTILSTRLRGNNCIFDGKKHLDIKILSKNIHSSENYTMYILVPP